MSINIDSIYYQANLKNRRVLGLQSKSVSFRTHKKELLPDCEVDVNLGTKTIHLQVPRMAFISRLWLFGLVNGNAGAKICHQEDMKILTLLQSSAEIKSYLSQLPQVISFRMFEYEKQLLYLKCWLARSEAVIQLRELYHSPISLDPSVYTDDPDVFYSLLYGINIEALEQVLSFEPLKKHVENISLGVKDS
jgi:hypothetical protein